MVELLDTFEPWNDTTAREKAGVEADDYSSEALAKISAEQKKAKDRFFFLFNRWFYDLSI